VAASARPAAIVLAGDLFGYPDGYATVEEAQRADSDLLSGMLEPLGIPVLYIMGNDDFIEMPGGPNLRPLHMTSTAMGSHTFVGYQYSLPFMGGVFEKPEERIQADLSEIEYLVGERTILVTHCPAHGILDAGMLGHNIGSTSIRDLIATKRPRLHIHGHCHSSFGRQGNHFNVASARNKRAMLIDVDTLRHQVIAEG